MNELTLAKAYLFVDDPYGDGIRLLHVREPSVGRVVATNIVYYGQSSFDAVGIMLAERGDDIRKWVSTKTGRSSMVRNSDLTESEVNYLKENL
jgi:hypothetical protein